MDVIRSDYEYQGIVTFSGTLYAPPESFDNTHISSDTNNRIDDNKLIHRPDVVYGQADGANVASETKLLRLCKGAGEVLDVQVRPTTAPTGGDKKFTVDVQKASDGSASWTSVLTAAIQVAAGDANNTLKSGVLIADPSTVAGDALRVVITASGSTGSQGQGVVVTVAYREQSTY